MERHAWILSQSKADSFHSFKFSELKRNMTENSHCLLNLFIRLFKTGITWKSGMIKHWGLVFSIASSDRQESVQHVTKHTKNLEFFFFSWTEYCWFINLHRCPFPTHPLIRCMCTRKCPRQSHPSVRVSKDWPLQQRYYGYWTVQMSPM